MQAMISQYAAWLDCRSLSKQPSTGGLPVTCSEASANVVNERPPKHAAGGSRLAEPTCRSLKLGVVASPLSPANACAMAPSVNTNSTPNSDAEQPCWLHVEQPAVWDPDFPLDEIPLPRSLPLPSLSPMAITMAGGVDFGAASTSAEKAPVVTTLVAQTSTFEASPLQSPLQNL